MGPDPLQDLIAVAVWTNVKDCPIEALPFEMDLRFSSVKRDGDDVVLPFKIDLDQSQDVALTNAQENILAFNRGVSDPSCTHFYEVTAVAQRYQDSIISSGTQADP